MANNRFENKNTHRPQDREGASKRLGCLGQHARFRTLMLRPAVLDCPGSAASRTEQRHVKHKAQRQPQKRRLSGQRQRISIVRGSSTQEAASLDSTATRQWLRRLNILFSTFHLLLFIIIMTILMITNNIPISITPVAVRSVRLRPPGVPEEHRARRGSPPPAET